MSARDHGVQIVTPELLSHHSRELSVMSVGDKTCSINNIDSSCFAAELCGSVHGGVALTSAVPNDSRGMFIFYLNGSPVGFVCGISAQDALPTLSLFDVALRHGDGFLSNLCVNMLHRGKGIGNLLVTEVLRHYSRVFLTVVSHRNEETDEFLRPRSARLAKTTKRRAFT